MTLVEVSSLWEATTPISLHDPPPLSSWIQILITFGLFLCNLTPWRTFDLECNNCSNSSFKANSISTKWYDIISCPSAMFVTKCWGFGIRCSCLELFVLAFDASNWLLLELCLRIPRRFSIWVSDSPIAVCKCKVSSADNLTSVCNLLSAMTSLSSSIILRFTDGYFRIIFSTNFRAPNSDEVPPYDCNMKSNVLSSIQCLIEPSDLMSASPCVL